MSRSIVSDWKEMYPFECIHMCSVKALLKVIQLMFGIIFTVDGNKFTIQFWSTLMIKSKKKDEIMRLFYEMAIYVRLLKKHFFPFKRKICMYRMQVYDVTNTQSTHGRKCSDYQLCSVHMDLQRLIFEIQLSHTPKRKMSQQDSK